jgi:hypothetical protein
MAEDQVTVLHAADVIECGFPDHGVAGDQLVGRNAAPRRGRQYPGSAYLAWIVDPPAAAWCSASA